MQAVKLLYHTFRCPSETCGEVKHGEGERERRSAVFHNQHSTAGPQKLNEKQQQKIQVGKEQGKVCRLYEGPKLPIPLKEKNEPWILRGEKRKRKQGLDWDRNKETKLNKIVTKREDGKKGGGAGAAGVSQRSQPAPAPWERGRADAGVRRVVADCNCNPTS